MGITNEEQQRTEDGLVARYECIHMTIDILELMPADSAARGLIYEALRALSDELAPRLRRG
jgi:hypothetical protein